MLTVSGGIQVRNCGGVLSSDHFGGDFRPAAAFAFCLLLAGGGFTVQRGNWPKLLAPPQKANQASNGSETNDFFLRCFRETTRTRGPPVTRCFPR